MKDKKKVISVAVICAVALITVVAVIVIGPTGKNTPPKNEESSESVVITTQEITTQEEASSQAETETESNSVSVPSPTESTTDPYKNYTLFIDKRTFKYEEQNGITVIAAIENPKITVTIKPHKDISYTNLCEQVKENYRSYGKEAMLEIENIHSVYFSETGKNDGDIFTTVYCIDDGNGGSVEIIYTSVVGIDAFDEDIDLLLSMFKTI